MEIVHYPHPALRWKSKPIKEINAALRETVSEMFDLMYEAKGIGLAANQVALPYRLFIINPTADPEQKDQEFVFINPEITSRKGSELGEEGCLSLPELYGDVRRAEKITVEAYSIKGKPFALELTDLPSRVVQHEYDHIEGVIFPDRMTEAGQRELQSRMQGFTDFFRKQQANGDVPSDEALKKQLRELEP